MSRMLFNPRGVYRREENPIAPRPHSLHRKVLGIVDNGKVNADLLLDHIEKRLRRAFDIAKVIVIRKSGVGTPASFTSEFLQACDFAVNGLGD